MTWYFDNIFFIENFIFVDVIGLARLWLYDFALCVELSLFPEILEFKPIVLPYSSFETGEIAVFYLCEGTVLFFKLTLLIDRGEETTFDSGFSLI